MPGLQCARNLSVVIYRKVKKPIVKKWCYTPSEESGLTDFQSLAQPAEKCPRKCEQVSPSFLFFLIITFDKSLLMSQAVKTGQCDSSCVEFEYLCGVCVPPPPQRTCPRRCEAAANSGE